MNVSGVEPNFKGEAFLVICMRECGFRQLEFVDYLCGGRLEAMELLKRVNGYLFLFLISVQ